MGKDQNLDKKIEEGKKRMFVKKRPGLQKEKGLAPPSASPYMLKHWTKTDKVRKNFKNTKKAAKLVEGKLGNRFPYTKAIG